MSINVAFVERLIWVSRYKLSGCQAKRSMDLELQNYANEVSGKVGGKEEGFD